MMNMNTKFRNWIFNSFSVSPEGLGLYRIFTALFTLLFLLPPTEMYEVLGSIPDVFYSPPPGPMLLFDGFPSEMIFLTLHSVLIISLLCLLVGYKTFYSSIIAGLMLLAIKGFFYSLGKINHDLLLSVVPIVMSFSGWGAAYSVDARQRNNENQTERVESWPLTLIALFIGFMMFTAGFAKLLGGWLYIDSQATLGHLFNQFFVKGRQDLLATQIILIDNRLVWEVLDYATVLFEIGFLVAVIHPRTTRLFVCFAVLFHFSIMMSLNISFLPNFPAYAAFLSWTAIDQRTKQWLTTKGAAPLALGGFFLLLGLAIWVGSRSGIPSLDSDLQVHEFYILLAAVPVAIYYVGRQITVLWRDLKSSSV